MADFGSYGYYNVCVYPVTIANFSITVVESTAPTTYNLTKSDFTLDEANKRLKYTIQYDPNEDSPSFSITSVTTTDTNVLSVPVITTCWPSSTDTDANISFKPVNLYNYSGTSPSGIGIQMYGWTNSTALQDFPTTFYTKESTPHKDSTLYDVNGNVLDVSTFAYNGSSTVTSASSSTISFYYNNVA